MKLPKYVKQLYNDTYVITEKMMGEVYMFLFVGREKALLVDSGYNTIPLAKIVHQLTDKPIVVANTHGHIDHEGGNASFDVCYVDKADFDLYGEHTGRVTRRQFLYKFLGKNAETIAKLPILKGIINKICDIEQLAPTEMPQSFNLGGRKIDVIKTPGHTQGSVCFLDEENKALFSGDMVCDEGVLLMFDHSTSVSIFRESMNTLKQLAEAGKYDRIYPSHHRRVLTNDFVDDYISLATDIIEGKTEGKMVTSGLADGYVAKYKSISIAYDKAKIL